MYLAVHCFWLREARCVFLMCANVTKMAKWKSDKTESKLPLFEYDLSDASSIHTSDTESDIESIDLDDSSDSDREDSPTASGVDSDVAATGREPPFALTGDDGFTIHTADPDDVLKIFECISNDTVIQFICDEKINMQRDILLK